MNWKNIKNLVIGSKKDPTDPRIFRNISLVALLAWVGLGADGLSSACYGPEEAFVALNGHGFLAIYMAILVGLTIAVISLSYSQIIETFPFGGGGYTVATKLISPSAGLVAGSALVIDYIMTIAISAASGMDAIFSFLPAEYHHSYKLLCIILAVLILIVLNLRGVKESITILTPIFFTFIITHLIMLSLAVGQNSNRLFDFLGNTIPQTTEMAQSIGLWGIIVIILKAYSHGAGTYTGIEAVSNALPTLREPKSQTGKKTMLYMAVSLALLSGGLLIFYGVLDISRVAGKTLNASLFERITQNGGFSLGHWFVILTLVSEAALLFVAAQTGFIDGPRVMANMSLDYWMPRRFAYLSEQLTISNGIMFMGFGAIGIVLLTGGHVGLLVVLYSINVFITFSLSQFGMCRHWLKIKKMGGQWRNKFAVNLTGFLLTTLILVILVYLKFSEGGWLTLLLTSGFVLLAVLIKRYYAATRRALKRLDDMLVNLPRAENPPPVPDKVAPGQQTAVILVNGFNGFGIHTFLSVEKLFPKIFKRYVFVSVGELDTGQFKGVHEVEHLRAETEDHLKKYIQMANNFGFYAEYRFDVSVNTIETLVSLCNDIGAQYARSVFFVNKLVFKKESFLTTFLHNDTAFRLQHRLAFEGKQLVVMPVRVY